MGEEAVELKRPIQENVLDDALETPLVTDERKKARPENSERDERESPLPPARSGPEQEPERQEDQNVLERIGTLTAAAEGALSKSCACG
jgi:hypothetical protein